MEGGGRTPYIVCTDNLPSDVPKIWSDKYQCNIAIRKLSPKECFRLQGWDDEYFYRAKLVNSDNQLYKQSGNGITINVVAAIGKLIA